MEYKDFIKYGNTAVELEDHYGYHGFFANQKDWRKIRKGVVTIISNPRNEYGQFSALGVWNEEELQVKVRNEKNEEYYLTLENLLPNIHVSDLDFEELKKLRTQISLGSCYLADYKNDWGIPENEVSDYADGFGEETEWKPELDTPDNFANYCLYGSIAA